MTKIPEKKSRKEKDFFDDFFETDALFDEYMNQIEQRLAMILEEINSRYSGTKGFVYGFSISGGPDGKPIIQEFSNTFDEPDEESCETEDYESPINEEPLLDVIENPEDVRVIAEVGGYNPEDIRIKVNGRMVNIEARKGKRTFSRKISLPAEVKQAETKTTYKNGVLEIVLKKV